jgi:hypothetical protein
MYVVVTLNLVSPVYFYTSNKMKCVSFFIHSAFSQPHTNLLSLRMTAVHCDQNKEGSAWCGDRRISCLYSQSLGQGLTKLSSILIMTARNCCLKLSLKIFEQDIVAWVLNRQKDLE